MINVKVLKHESFRFIVVGVSSVVIDFVFYMWLISTGVPTYFSRGVSYFIVLFYSYLLNTHYTFSIGKISKSLFFRYWVLYLLVLIFNVTLNELLLLTFNKSQYAIVLIYFFVTALSAIINFKGIKHYVFSKKII